MGETPAFITLKGGHQADDATLCVLPKHLAGFKVLKKKIPRVAGRGGGRFSLYRAAKDLNRQSARIAAARLIQGPYPKYATPYPPLQTKTSRVLFPLTRLIIANSSRRRAGATLNGPDAPSRSPALVH